MWHARMLPCEKAERTRASNTKRMALHPELYGRVAQYYSKRKLSKKAAKPYIIFKTMSIIVIYVVFQCGIEFQGRLNRNRLSVSIIGT